MDKRILYLFFSALLISSVYAVDYTGYDHRWQVDSNFADTNNTHNLSGVSSGIKTLSKIGNGSVNMSGTNSLSTGQTYSGIKAYSFWLYNYKSCPHASGCGVYGYIRYTSDLGFGIWQMSGTNALTIDAFQNTPTLKRVSTTTINNLEWYFITVVFYSSNMSIFINGVYNTSVAVTAPYTNADTATQFGVGMSPSVGNSVEGQLDDMRVFTTNTPSVTQIMDMYIAGSSGIVPTISNVSALPPTNSNSDLNCTFNVTDSDSSNLNVSVTWFQNISSIVTRNNTNDYTYINPTQNTIYTTSSGTGSLVGKKVVNAYYLCMANVSDDKNNVVYLNSSWIQMPSGIGSNLSANLQFNNNFAVRVYDNITECIQAGVYSNDSGVSCTNGLMGNFVYNSSCSIVGSQSITALLTPFCSDGSSEKNATAYAVYIDNIDPIITTNMINDSFIFGRNITGQINLSDASSIYRWNITIDGVSIASAMTPSYLLYVYNLSRDVSNLMSGIHYMNVTLVDGHTAKEISDYNVKKGGLFDDSYLEFDTKSNKIRIQAMDEESEDTFDIQKNKDRYKFSYKPKMNAIRLAKPVTEIVLKDAEYDDKGQVKKAKEVKEVISMSFKIIADKRIDIITREDSELKKWLISGNNWIDFYSPDLENEYISIFKDVEHDNIAYVVVYYDPKNRKDTIQFESIGELNTISQLYTFYTLNYSLTYSPSVFESSYNTFTLSFNTTNTTIAYSDISINMTYNNSLQNASKTQTGNIINFESTVLSPSVTTLTNISFSYNISISSNKTNVTGNQSINFIGISYNCSSAPYVQSLNFCGYDEVSFNPVNMTLDMNIEVIGDIGVVKEYGFRFNQTATCYPICIFPNTTSYLIDAKLSYGYTPYSDRKFYLLNENMTNVSKNVSLYHILSNDASDVVITVYDKTKGSRIEGAYVKILRYYAGLNNLTSASYKTVEVERTDANGLAGAKLILADVWYKFIVEYPKGTVVYNGDIEKIYSAEKLIPVNLNQGNLITYFDNLKLNGDVECIKNTKVCTFTWSNPSGSDVTGTLRIYRDNGFTKSVVYEESLTSSSAEIAYQILENTTGHRYYAEGWIS